MNPTSTLQTITTRRDRRITVLKNAERRSITSKFFGSFSSIDRERVYYGLVLMTVAGYLFFLYVLGLVGG